jgi:dihydropteroate synthase
VLDISAISEILRRYGDDVGAPVRGFEIGGRAFDFTRERALMGVINLSPDSWYSESICTSEPEAVARGIALAEGGADFVDVGAESTLPHAARVAPAEQIARMTPVVEALAARGILVSVESYHPEVLEACARAGAKVFNLTGMREEREVLKLARRFEAAVVFCYVQGESPRQVGDFTFAENMIGELEDYFRERTSHAAARGVHRCIIDPGLGFYYENLQDGRLRVNHQINTFLHTFRLHRLGFPTMNILPHAPEVFGADHRRAAEPFFAVLALLAGTHLIRTHELDVVARVRAVMAMFEEDGAAP